ncbi:EamA family transporter RarD [Phenylobacterium sp.]|uniref:EamA family transporter RarD n=1 Tax=Phenylobacterium sp. TaxID=1871053 RepID=UPI0035B0281E
MSQPSSAPGGEARLALTAGIGCYFIWGFVPLVFQAMGHLGVGAWEILAHRIFWGAPTSAVFVAMARQWGQVRRVLRRPRVLGLLVLSAALIAVNWTIFIMAVNSGRVLETSLGYFINPLLNMATGALIFRERLDRTAMAAIGLAVVGVVLQTAALGHLPIISLTLAVSFLGYGLVRKQVAAEAQTGLFIECLALAPFAAGLIFWLEAGGGHGHFLTNPAAAAWMVACGPLTAAPLVLFAWSARRMPLSAIGFLQFIAPSITFFMGLAEGEAFTPLRAVSFAFIWAGAAVFALGAWRRGRRVATLAAQADA